ncbi:MAG TPA: polymer-forming cytoskeletal protein [Thermomicrobiales bacterium]|nr:polymer-forming cytoskeletal protein [Thermomicrobiales bacterium]
MVFRKDNKVDSFQRQISALRQQLGADGEAERPAGFDRDHPDASDLPTFPKRDAADYGLGNYGAGAASSFASANYDLDQPPMATEPTIDSQTSVVAHDTTWKGDLQTGGSIHVHGRVEGSIEARDDVYVAEEADVNATIAATNVAVAGVLRGTVRCSGRFEVLPQGRVQGEVHAPSLVIHEGAVINGQFRMTGAEASVTAETPSLVRRRAARTGA